MIISIQLLASALSMLTLYLHIMYYVLAYLQ